MMDSETAMEVTARLPLAEYAARIKRAQAGLQAQNVDYLLLAPSSDLRYLTGLDARVSERLNLFVVPREGKPAFYAPALEAMEPAALAQDGLFNLIVWQEDEDATALFARAALRRETDSGNQQTPISLAVGEQMWAGFLLRLQQQLPHAIWYPALPITGPLRLIKTAAEIAALAEIGAAADEVFARLITIQFSGRKELEIADVINHMLRDRGHQNVKFAIVASGPNGASPHHTAGERVIQAGDFVVLDFGGPGFHGYGSDISRTVFVAGAAEGFEPTPEQIKVYTTVFEAQELAFEAVRPGVTAQELDRVARDHIAAAGYGPAFLHRLGHGIGLDGHEPPYLVQGNVQEISAGMAFSDEPGIYLDGRFGVRIEDIIVCEASGGRRLNNAARELIRVK